ncbi:hypothetical protein ACFX2I_023116 [Malus domestica]
MYKNQLQELAQRSCFNLPSYACTREGPDHAPRFKASVNFNHEIFESPAYCTTVRQAEHAAAEVALNKLSTRGPSRSLTARVLDETGIYKNLLQETAHRAGLKLPVYTTVRSGPGHVPVFTCTVELAGMNFTGEPAKTKKQAEKNAAIAAWFALKKNLGFSTNKEAEEEQAVVTRLLSNFKPRDDNNNNNSKQFMRRMDPIQARRRIVRSSSSLSLSSSSSSSSTSSLQNQNSRLVDLLTDLVPQVSTVQKQNTFASLLPPPPPRTTSKILPPSTMLNKDKSPSHPPLSDYRPIPVQVSVRGGSKVIPPPLEQHQRDEEEWLGIVKEDPSGSNSSGIFGSSGSAYRQFPVSNAGNYGAFELSCPIKAAPGVKISKRQTSGFNMYSGGLSPHKNFAPAVQMRSVIPVCAAPPAPVRPSIPTKVMAMKGISSGAEVEAGLSLSDSTNSSSWGRSRWKMPESSSSSTQQLGSEFNKLQLGGGNKDISKII